MQRADQRKTARRWGAFRAAVRNKLTRHCDVFTFTLATLAAIALTTCTSHPAHATMTPAQKCAGAEHTILEAVATPTDKRRFVMPEHLAGRGASTPSRHGCGQDAPVREAGGTTSSVCSTSCPPNALEQAAGGVLSVSLEGA